MLVSHLRRNTVVCHSAQHWQIRIQTIQASVFHGSLIQYVCQECTNMKWCAKQDAQNCSVVFPCCLFVCERIKDVHAWFCVAGGSDHLETWAKECSDYRLPFIFQCVLNLENNYFPGREALSNRFGCRAWRCCINDKQTYVCIIFITFNTAQYNFTKCFIYFYFKDCDS